MTIQKPQRGGRRPGAGRPPEPERPKPVSWRPDTQAQRDKWLEIGGARWLKRTLDELIEASKRRGKRLKDHP